MTDTATHTERALDKAKVWTLSTPLKPDELLNALQHRAKRGKLAEFARGPLGKAGGDFSVDAPAMPFDHRLVATLHPEGETTRIELRLVRLKQMPLIFAAVLAVTIWPGVWLTDSMLSVYFGWYASWTQSMPWLTYAWYLPLTAGPIPWIWQKMVRKSHQEALASGNEMVDAIIHETKGTRLA